MYASYGGKDENNERIEKVFESLRYSFHLFVNELIKKEDFAGFVNGQWSEQLIPIVSVIPTSLRAKCISNVSDQIAHYNINKIIWYGLDNLKQRISELQLPEAIAAEIFLNIRKKFLGNDASEDDPLYKGKLALGHKYTGEHHLTVSITTREEHEQALAAHEHVHHDQGHHEVSDGHNVQVVVNDGEAENDQDNNLQ